MSKPFSSCSCSDLCGTISFKFTQFKRTQIHISLKPAKVAHFSKCSAGIAESLMSVGRETSENGNSLSVATLNWAYIVKRLFSK